MRLFCLLKSDKTQPRSNKMSSKPLSEKNKDFFDLVYEVVKLIPEGRVTSYGAIAKYLGAARSSRMVGWAMNASHRMSDVPAQRVVNRNGLLTGKMHFGDPNEMQRLLEKEGHAIQDDQIMNFKDSFWDPSIELRID
jgi:methylated-DNA-protein-cysteine methyltransferase-like protein